MKKIIDLIKQMFFKKERVVYVITSDCYEDYNFNCVFDNKKDANKFLDLLGCNKDPNGYGFRVEETTINPCIEELKKGLTPFKVTLNRDKKPDEVAVLDYYDYGVYKFQNGNNKNLLVSRENILEDFVWAKNSDHARNIVLAKIKDLN